MPSRTTLLHPLALSALKSSVLHCLLLRPCCLKTRRRAPDLGQVEQGDEAIDGPPKAERVGRDALSAEACPLKVDNALSPSPSEASTACLDGQTARSQPRTPLFVEDGKLESAFSEILGWAEDDSDCDS